MNSTMCIGNLNYAKEKLPPAQIEKVLAILDNKEFGVRNKKDLKKVVEKIQRLRENVDGDGTD